MASFKVYAGCDSEGTILQGQPYAGPMDVQSLADFVSETLRGSPYHSSNTCYGAELDWADAELQDGVEGGEATWALVDLDDADADGDADTFSGLPTYWIWVVPNEAV